MTGAIVLTNLKDDPAKFVGTPVVLQVATKRLEDEKALAIVEVISNVLKDNQSSKL